MNKSIFITGTDTDIGKTFVCVGLCLYLENLGLKVGYFKPFQSGAYIENSKKLAPDIEEIKKYSNNIETKYSYLLDGEISPYLASKLNCVEIDIEKVKNDLDEIKKNNDYTIIEGAGGLYCPAYKDNLFIDVIDKLNQELIVVTKPDLGRINHTLMTLECAKNRGIKVKGVIINSMPLIKNEAQKHFIEELSAFSDVEILGIVPRMDKFSKGDIIEAFEFYKKFID